MAAPHVSGAAAALMSVKTEAKGNSAMVKDILLRSCTDLKRKRDFQGAGLLDLLRAMQLT
jgi:serine protease AprX